MSSITTQNNHIVLTESPDEKGLIHRITGVLFEHGLNIEDQAQYVDPSHDKFFMRTVASGALDEGSLSSALRDVLPASSEIRIASGEKKKIVICATRAAHCLGDLLIRHEYGGLHAEIQCVISNHETLRSLVERFNIPFHYISHKDLSREQHEEQLVECISSVSPDYIVLARYMRVLTSDFVEKFPQQIVNIHHSFLPAFIGARPYRQALERGVKVIGATAHFVTSELDGGPIISQDVIPVDHSKSEEDMIAAGQNVEVSVLAEALRLVFHDRVFVDHNRTIVFS